MKLRVKFLLSLLFVVTALTTTTLIVVQRTFESQFRQVVAHDFRLSSDTFTAFQRDRDAGLFAWAEFMAEIPEVRALLTTDDAATVQDGSATYAAASRSDIFMLADKRGNLLALHSSTRDFNECAASHWVAGAMRGRQERQWWFAAGHLFHIFSQPVYFGNESHGYLLGYVFIGYEVSNAVASNVAHVAENQVVFLYDKSTAASTFPPPMIAAHSSDFQRLAMRGGMSAPTEIRLGGEQYLATSVSLSSSPVPVTLLVLKSSQPANSVLSAIHSRVVALGFAAILIGCLLVLAISKTFSKPLDELLAGVRALAHQNFDYPVVTHDGDEFGELTRAFDHMRKSLMAAQQRLLQAEQLATIGRMASSLSHDLRHRLTAILANSEFLVDQSLTLSRREQLYSGIQLAVRQMTDLLQSLVEFSRTRESLRYSYFDLREVIEDSVQMIRLHPEAKGVSVRAELPDEMKAWFDGTKLRRVFFNLLFNACQAHATRIEIQSSRIGRSAVIRISDNGDGIPEFVRASLFQPFVTGKQNGTGVGLAIVHKCCRDHGGDVTLEATAPGQTIFRITLPLAGSEGDAESEAMTRTEITA